MATIKAGNLHAIPEIFDARFTEISGSALLKVRRLRRFLQTVGEDFESTKSDLRNRFFERGEDGEFATKGEGDEKRYVVIEGKDEEFEEEWHAIHEHEIEIPDDIRLTLEDLEGVKFHWRDEQILDGILAD